MPDSGERLERAKQALTIADSADSKREAYRIAAEEIAAYREETGASIRAIASSLARDRNVVDRLLRWYRAGCPEGTTPNTMADGSGPTPTERAAQSHTRSTLRDPSQRREVLDSLSPEDRAAVAREALEDEEVVDEVVRTAPGTAHRLGARVAARPHPSREPNPLPGGVPEPEVGFRMAMAGPLSRLADAVEDVVRGWEAGADDAREIEREGVQDTIARHSARLAALITSMEVPS